jgi:hypothetical protein
MDKIRTKVEFSGVPKGTTGTSEVDGKEFKITWDLPNRAKPLVDWFSKDEFEQFLEII